MLRALSASMYFFVLFQDLLSDAYRPCLSGELHLEDPEDFPLLLRYLPVVPPFSTIFEVLYRLKIIKKLPECVLRVLLSSGNCQTKPACE